MAGKLETHDSSGNLFADLGFEPAAARELQLKSDLMILVAEQIRSMDATQAEIARLLSVAQPRVSNLLHGRLDLFSFETLVSMLEKLGNVVDVTVIRRDADRRPEQAFTGDCLLAADGATAAEVLVQNSWSSAELLEDTVSSTDTAYALAA
jgi:predicted XRE-type DNA-binding protein